MSDSLWLMTSYPRDNYPRLAQDVTADVLIIGGGLSGIANAYFLAKEGKDVVLLEKDLILSGATGNSTGKLTAQHDYVYANLIKKFGVDDARLYYEVNEKAMEFGRSFATGDELYEADSVLYSQTKEGTEKLREEWKAYEQIGIKGEFGKRSELPVPVEATLIIPGESQIHPVRFGQKLAKMAVQAGARFYEQTEVSDMNLEDRFVTVSSGARVKFTELVLCTHYPIEALRGGHVSKLSVNRSYIVSAEVDTPMKGQYISVDKPKRSVRTAIIDGKTYFMMAGDGHQAGEKEDTQPYYDVLFEDIKEQYNLSKFTNQWSAQDPETPDLIPYAGRISSGVPFVHISTGYRKWGLTNSMASARIISDLILGNPNPAAALYAPDRSDFGSVFVQFLKTSGIVIKELATGYTTRLDTPTCTHMGCKTKWNESDQTWDCPCHGSRFRADGSVLEGPAMRPLDLTDFQ